MKLVRRFAHVVSILVPLIALAPRATVQAQERPTPTQARPDNAGPAENGAVVFNQTFSTTPKQDQTDDKRGKLWPDGIIAIATVVIAVFGILQCLIYFAMKTHNMAIERAYVGFGHVTRDGGQIRGREGEMISSLGGPRMPLFLSLQLHNFGNTPTDIENAVLAIHVARGLGDEPDYTRRQVMEDSRIFLVKNGDFWTPEIRLDVTPDEWVGMVSDGDIHRTLWVLGYVEYRDRFKNRHKAAFARRYAPHEYRLIFETQRGYNYDRPIDEAGNFTDEPEGLRRYLFRMTNQAS